MNIDIDIFLVTCNRIMFLNDAIKSILQQSIKIENINILDNSEDFNTDVERLVINMNDERLKYYRTTSLGRHGNYKKILELSKKKYLAIFHDDDILHPNYLEMFSLALNNSKEEIRIFACGRNCIDENQSLCDLKFDNLKSEFFVTKHASIFLHYFYSNFFDIITPSLIYSREAFLDSDNISLYNDFGKISDNAKLILASLADNNKNIVILLDNAYFYRRHNLQDTKKKNGLSLLQICKFINLLNCSTYLNIFNIYDILYAFHSLCYTNVKFERFLQHFIKINHKTFFNKFRAIIFNIYINRHKNTQHYFKYLLIKYPYKVYHKLFKLIQLIIYNLHIKKYS